MHNPVINMGNGADLDSRSSQDRGLRTKGNRGREVGESAQSPLVLQTQRDHFSCSSSVTQRQKVGFPA